MSEEIEDFLESEEFYEQCQIYRHSSEFGPGVKPHEAFQYLKLLIRLELNTLKAEVEKAKREGWDAAKGNLVTITIVDGYEWITPTTFDNWQKSLQPKAEEKV